MCRSQTWNITACEEIPHIFSWHKYSKNYPIIIFFMGVDNFVDTSCLQISNENCIFAMYISLYWILATMSSLWMKSSQSLLQPLSMMTMWRSTIMWRAVWASSLPVCTSCRWKAKRHTAAIRSPYADNLRCGLLHSKTPDAVTELGSCITLALFTNNNAAEWSE